MDAALLITLLCACAAWAAVVWLMWRLSKSDDLLRGLLAAAASRRLRSLILLAAVGLGLLFLVTRLGPRVGFGGGGAPPVKVTPGGPAGREGEATAGAGGVPVTEPRDTTQVNNPSAAEPRPLTGRGARPRHKEAQMLFGSIVLEVAIGMIFVFLLLSLLCSAVVEYIEAKLSYRSKDLEKGIRLLLDQYAPGEKPKDNSNTDAGAGAVSLAAMLYEHPLVKSLYRGEKLPSYIPSRTFALALWDMAFPPEQRVNVAGGPQSLPAVREAIRTSTFIGSDLRRTLLALIDDAQGDFDKARSNIEDWYDSTMDRVSGWYKRRVHYILLIIGLFASALVNADTINLTRALMQNDALRQSVVVSAEKAAAAPTPVPTPTPADPRERARLASEKIQDVRTQLDTLGLPLGWVRNPVTPDDPRRFPDSAGGWALKVLGILITALAVSQGAPFWFDLLNKIIVIRSTVKPKEKSREQPSKDKPAPETEQEEEPKD